MIIFTNGVDQYLDCGSAAVLDDLSALTLITLTRVNSLLNATVIASKKSSGGTVAGWVCRMNGTTGQLTFNKRYASDALTYQSADNLAAPAGNWRWLAYAWDEAGSTGDTVRLYGGPFQGAIVVTSSYATATEETSGANSDAAQPFRIANYGGGGTTSTPTADIEYVILYNRRLSAAEIQQVIDGLEEIGVNPVTSGLIGEWRVGWAGGTSANDITANNNDGTATGSPTNGAGVLELVSAKPLHRGISRGMRRGMGRGLS